MKKGTKVTVTRGKRQGCTGEVKEESTMCPGFWWVGLDPFFEEKSNGFITDRKEMFSEAQLATEPATLKAHHP